jgi:hypothetical protein
VFPRNEAVSLSNIDRWVSSHLAGKLDPTLRSGAGADEKWLQASHWQEQLEQNSQNMKFTLVAFTARWCGFCKTVPPLVRIIDQVQCDAQFSPLHLSLLIRRFCPKRRCQSTSNFLMLMSMMLLLPLRMSM